MMASLSGSTPRLAWWVRIDSVGYADVYLASAMATVAWIVSLGSVFDPSPQGRWTSDDGIEGG